MKLDEVRWGMIGAGDVTEVKSGPALRKVEHSNLVAVMRRDSEKARDYAERHNVPNWYDDADELINDADVNAVYVATPPYAHAEYTLRAAEAGKAVYVEKPMALNYDECRQMIDACENAGISLFTAFYRRRLPSFLKVKELVETGSIGEVRFVNMELYMPPRKVDMDTENPDWHVVPEIAGGGHFFDLAPHQLDFLDYLFGPVAQVKGVAKNQAGYYEAEDIVAANLWFESEVVGNGVWCFTVSEESSTDRIMIAGSEGHIEFPCFGPPELTLTTNLGTEKFEFENPQHVQQPLIETIVQELLGEGQCPSTGKSGARTAWVMDEVVKNYREK